VLGAHLSLVAGGYDLNTMWPDISDLLIGLNKTSTAAFMLVRVRLHHIDYG
jgi:hypothetical protein